MSASGPTLPADYSADFRGLVTTLVFSLVILSIGLVVHFCVGKVKRDTIYWRTNGSARELSSEDFGFGYLYYARRFVVNADTSQPIPKWPLQWIVRAWRLKETWLRDHVGLDATCYVRTLRACWYYVVLQLLTTFPTLLTINLTHATGSTGDIAAASLSSLIATDYGRSLLWLQVLFLYWLSWSWFAAILWAGVGMLRHRQTLLARLMTERASERLEERAGWRFRTICVQNIPSDLGYRDPKALTAYFEQGLEFAPLEQAEDLPLQTFSEKPATARGFIDQVVLVRRSAQLQASSKKRIDALHNLEAAHIQLAKNVLGAVDTHLRAKESQEPVEDATLDALAAALSPYLDRSKAYHETTVWEVLANLPRELLNPYQPMHQLRKRFKGQRVPAIDYWALKVRILDATVREQRNDPERFSPASTAFVTFRLASDARRACQFMPSHPTRLFAVKTRMAPETRDILWDKLVRVSFRSDVLRSILSHTLIWFATLVWVLPVSLFVAVISLDNIANFVPALANYLAQHRTTKAILTTSVPTLATSIITFFVPTILNQLTIRLQHLFTVSKLFHRVGFRYFVFLIVNVVILFAVGTTVVKAVFTDPQDVFAPETVLQRIASSFNAAAPFFVGWQI